MDIFPVYYPVTQENNFRNNDSVWAGALTASFSYLFNDVAHRWTMNYGKLAKVWSDLSSVLGKYTHDDEFEVLNFYAEEIGGPLGAWAKKSPDNFMHACAALMSYALNKAGYKIPHINNITFKGANGDYYFIRAAEMRDFLNDKFGQYKYLPEGRSANGIIYQTGFSGGITGHMDVLFLGLPAGNRYENVRTYYWESKKSFF